MDTKPNNHEATAPSINVEAAMILLKKNYA